MTELELSVKLISLDEHVLSNTVQGRFIEMTRRGGNLAKKNQDPIPDGFILGLFLKYFVSCFIPSPLSLLPSPLFSTVGIRSTNDY